MAKKFFAAALSVAAILSVSSCSKTQKEAPKMKLQNTAENEYVVDARNPEPIEFLVRSLNHDWEMYSENPDWCEIEPAGGEKAEICKVKVIYKPNMSLDGREDRLVMKSDGIVGKEIVVRQGGQAIAPAVVSGPSEIMREGGESSFTFTSNQKWSAKVTEGGTWLSIKSGMEGEPQGSDLIPEEFSVVLQSEKNNGDVKTGTVTVYDRNGKEAFVVTAHLQGAVFDLETVDLKTLYNDAGTTLKVTTSADWKAVKDIDDETTGWYGFEKTEFSGDGVLPIHLTENTGNEIRTATFTLMTMSDDESSAIKRTVTIRQAPAVKRHYFKDGVAVFSEGKQPSISESGAAFSGNNQAIAGNLKPGNYKFRVRRDSEDAIVRMFYIFSQDKKSSSELRWHLNAAATALSTTPWSASTNKNIDSKDTAKWYDIEMRMSETANGYINATWLLDGEVVKTIDTEKMKNASFAPALWNSAMSIRIGSGAGKVTFEWYESEFVWQD